MSAPEKEEWYVRTGKGMIATIANAVRRGAYTLTDRGTFIKYESQRKGNPGIVILIEGDDALVNQYSVIAVNPSRCDKVHQDLTVKFMDWIVSPPAQKLIGEFRLLGKQIYTPNANK